MLRYALLFISLGLLGCREEKIRLFLDSVETGAFYSEEIIPENYMGIYGQWKLQSIGGGFAGTGFEPNHDFLEIKRFGIYGVLRNDSLIEYGKVQLDTFDTQATHLLQVKLIPESSVESIYSPPEKYIDLKGPGEMELRSPCCDFYNYYYTR